LPRRVSIFLLLLFSLIGGICEGRASFSHTTYFKNHLVKTLTEPSTQTTTLAYNGKNLVSFKTDPTGAITYGYDDSGLLESVTEGTATISRSYDERGRLKTYTNADGDLIQYRYDANNNLTRLTYPDGKQVNYTYNARNLLATVTDWAGRTTTYQYDRIGRLTGTIRPNGTANIIAHDAASQLTSIKETANGKLISYLKFDYDAASQITRRFRAPLVNSGWQHPTFTATYDDDNRLSTINGQAVTHDADGNMTNGPIRQDSGHLNLTYNSRNQLTSADDLSYTYDAEGHRRTITNASGTSRDVIDPSSSLSRLLVRHHPDNTKTYYVYGLGLLYEVDQAGKTKTHHYDQVGSTIARTDDTGKVIGKAEYSAFGITFWKQGDMATPFLYNGQAGVQTDPNGLLNMRARYYSPYLMRFLNADPIGFSGGMNWFAFADGNPISLSDPFGLQAAQNDFFGQVMDRVNGLSNSMFAASRDPQGASAAGVDRLVNGVMGGGNAPFGAVEPLQSAGVYQEGSYADQGGDFMATYYMTANYAGGVSSAWGAPRNSVVSGGGMKQVTSWAATGTTPDLNPGRWVQLGDATRVNFWKSGLPGGKVQTNPLRYERSNVPITNYISGQVPASSLRWPTGWEKPKGILGQRQINGGAK
jgi:RHS repeat-associated protein